MNKDELESLEQLLDEESDSDFGYPEVRDKFDPQADPTVPADLRSWTAEDFASIYVRFRPHLVRHASRYLSNPSQAEEVVQDAFLYLMTSLPELDSELGVLKFLKWKTKLLALDILGAAATRNERPLSDHSDFSADDVALDADLQRAEDAAIVRLALAKLNPRHRLAIVSSIYEEKSSREIADELGLSENATRQLMFRAREAFRKALVGEADVQGKSVSQILSIAARRASLSTKAGVVTSALLVVASIGIGFGGNLTPVGPEGLRESLAAIEPSQSPATDGESSQDSAPVVGEPSTNLEGDQELIPTKPAIEKDPVADEIPQATQTEPQVIEASAEVATTGQQPDVFARLEQTVLGTNISSAGMYLDSKAAFFSDYFQGTSIEIFGGTGISSFLDFDPNSKEIANIMFQVNTENGKFVGIPASWTTQQSIVDGNHFFEVTAREIHLVDQSGQVYSETPVMSSTVTVLLQVDSNSVPVSSALRVDRT